MPEKNNKTEISTEVVDREGYKGLSLTVRLILRLMGDSRVNILLKLLPIGALVYMIIPEPLPIIDDALVVGLGLYGFIELCPQDVVEEHRARLSGKVTEQVKNDDVVDTEFKS